MPKHVHGVTCLKWTLMLQGEMEMGGTVGQLGGLCHFIRLMQTEQADHSTELWSVESYFWYF